MSELMTSLDASYFRLALLEAVAIGVIGGMAGAFVVLRKLPMYVLALSHSTFPGVVVAAVVGVDALFGALVAAVLTAAIVAVWGASRTVDTASSTGVLLAGAFALGLVLSSWQGISSAQLVGYLVGSILTVTAADVAVAAAIAIGVFLAVVVFYKELLFSTFDAGGARALGYRVGAIDLGVLLVVGTAVVAMIPAVGTLLSLGLLTVPAMTARLLCNKAVPLLAVSTLIAVACSVGGVVLSAFYPVAVSGMIALCLGAVFLLALLVQGLVRMRTEPSALPTMASDA